VARIETGLEATLYLGNLDAKRDWGHARTTSKACTWICRQDAPDDFVLADRRNPFQCANSSKSRSPKWPGHRVARQGVEETGIDKKSGKTIVRIDPTYFRPNGGRSLDRRCSKARQSSAGSRKPNSRTSSGRWWRAISQRPTGGLSMANTSV